MQIEQYSSEFNGYKLFIISNYLIISLANGPGGKFFDYMYIFRRDFLKVRETIFDFEKHICRKCNLGFWLDSEGICK